MGVESIGIILIVGLLLLLALGVELAVALGVIASVGFIFFISQPQIQIAWSAWRIVNSFSLLAMPLFIFMGAMFSSTGVISRLFEGADKWIGGLPGGLAVSVIGAGAIFGAMSGSSIAAAATFSAIAFPEMEKKGYDPKLAVGSIAVAGNLSVFIPPSIILIIYGTFAEQSIARLFAAALIPGVVEAALLILTVMLMVTLNPNLAPKSPTTPWREKLLAAREILPWIGIIALVLGAIFGGIMTATEASALGAFLSVVVALAYRRCTYKALKSSLITAVRISAMIGFLLVTASLLAFVFQSSGLTNTFSSFMMGLPLGKYGTLVIICVIYLILGMFLAATPMLLLTLPFVMPIIVGFGFSPIWWGVMFVVLVEFAALTPPFAVNLFAIHGVLPQHSIFTIFAGVVPFLIPMFAMLAILIAFPDLALWLPDVLY